MKLPTTYHRLLRIPEDRVLMLPGDEAIDLSSIQGGILFVMAQWSGASQLSFRSLNSALGEMADLGDLHLYIADTDSEMTEAFMGRAGTTPSGCGEAYWIKDGTILTWLETCNGVAQNTIQGFTTRVLS